MDLQSSVQMSDRRWVLVKAAALLCFAIAGALMIVSLLNHGHARAGTTASFAAASEALRN